MDPLPEHPDLDVDESPAGLPLPVHLHAGLLAVVAVGGATGSLARYGLSELIGTPPVGTLGVNLVGSFALGVLLATLALRGSDVGRRRTARLLLGTGFLGGFTTYSALAVETDALLRDDRVLAGLGYGVGSVVGGVAAAALGILVTKRVAR